MSTRMYKSQLLVTLLSTRNKEVELINIIIITRTSLLFRITSAQTATTREHVTSVHAATMKDFKSSAAAATTTDFRPSETAEAETESSVPTNVKVDLNHAATKVSGEGPLSTPSTGEITVSGKDNIASADVFSVLSNNFVSNTIISGTTTHSEKEEPFSAPPDIIASGFFDRTSTLSSTSASPILTTNLTTSDKITDTSETISNSSLLSPTVSPSRKYVTSTGMNYKLLDVDSSISTLSLSRTHSAPPRTAAGTTTPLPLRTKGYIMPTTINDSVNISAPYFMQSSSTATKLFSPTATSLKNEATLIAYAIEGNATTVVLSSQHVSHVPPTLTTAIVKAISNEVPTLSESKRSSTAEAFSAELKTSRKNETGLSETTNLRTTMLPEKVSAEMREEEILSKMEAKSTTGEHEKSSVTERIENKATWDENISRVSERGMTRKPSYTEGILSTEGAEVIAGGRTGSFAEETKRTITGEYGSSEPEPIAQKVSQTKDVPRKETTEKTTAKDEDLSVKEAEGTASEVQKTAEPVTQKVTNSKQASDSENPEKTTRTNEDLPARDTKKTTIGEEMTVEPNAITRKVTDSKGSLSPESAEFTIIDGRGSLTKEEMGATLEKHDTSQLLVDKGEIFGTKSGEMTTNIGGKDMLTKITAVVEDRTEREIPTQEVRGPERTLGGMDTLDRMTASQRKDSSTTVTKEVALDEYRATEPETATRETNEREEGLEQSTTWSSENSFRLSNNQFFGNMSTVTLLTDIFDEDSYRQAATETVQEKTRTMAKNIIVETEDGTSGTEGKQQNDIAFGMRISSIDTKATQEQMETEVARDRPTSVAQGTLIARRETAASFEKLFQETNNEMQTTTGNPFDGERSVSLVGSDFSEYTDTFGITESEGAEIGNKWKISTSASFTQHSKTVASGRSEMAVNASQPDYNRIWSTSLPSTANELSKKIPHVAFPTSSFESSRKVDFISKEKGEESSSRTAASSSFKNHGLSAVSDITEAADGHSLNTKEAAAKSTTGESAKIPTKYSASASPQKVSYNSRGFVNTEMESKVAEEHSTTIQHNNTRFSKQSTMSFNEKRKNFYTTIDVRKSDNTLRGQSQPDRSSVFIKTEKSPASLAGVISYAGHERYSFSLDGTAYSGTIGHSLTAKGYSAKSTTTTNNAPTPKISNESGGLHLENFTRMSDSLDARTTSHTEVSQLSNGGLVNYEKGNLQQSTKTDYFLAPQTKSTASTKPASMTKMAGSAASEKSESHAVCPNCSSEFLTDHTDFLTNTDFMSKSPRALSTENQLNPQSEWSSWMAQYSPQETTKGLANVIKTTFNYSNKEGETAATPNDTVKHQNGEVSNAPRRTSTVLSDGTSGLNKMTSEEPSMRDDYNNFPIIVAVSNTLQTKASDGDVETSQSLVSTISFKPAEGINEETNNLMRGTFVGFNLRSTPSANASGENFSNIEITLGEQKFEEISDSNQSIKDGMTLSGFRNASEVDRPAGPGAASSEPVVKTSDTWVNSVDYMLPENMNIIEEAERGANTDDNAMTRNGYVTSHTKKKSDEDNLDGRYRYSSTNIEGNHVTFLGYDHSEGALPNGWNLSIHTSPINEDDTAISSSFVEKDSGQQLADLMRSKSISSMNVTADTIAFINSMTETVEGIKNYEHKETSPSIVSDNGNRRHGKTATVISEEVEQPTITLDEFQGAETEAFDHNDRSSAAEGNDDEEDDLNAQRKTTESSRIERGTEENAYYMTTTTPLPLIFHSEETIGAQYETVVGRTEDRTMKQNATNQLSAIEDSADITTDTIIDYAHSKDEEFHTAWESDEINGYEEATHGDQGSSNPSTSNNNLTEVSRRTKYATEKAEEIHDSAIAILTTFESYLDATDLNFPDGDASQHAFGALPGTHEKDKHLDSTGKDEQLSSTTMPNVARSAFASEMNSNEHENQDVYNMEVARKTTQEITSIEQAESGDPTGMQDGKTSTDLVDASHDDAYVAETPIIGSDSTLRLRQVISNESCKQHWQISQVGKLCEHGKHFHVLQLLLFCRDRVDQYHATSA
uniref:4_1_CTD domain-containing protein n=1 Tax=Ascaris lumbricoides TaxID=6252 RepID=A0A0M3HY59_ASCLU